MELMGIMERLLVAADDDDEAADAGDSGGTAGSWSGTCHVFRSTERVSAVEASLLNRQIN